MNPGPGEIFTYGKKLKNRPKSNDPDILEELEKSRKIYSAILTHRSRVDEVQIDREAAENVKEVWE